MLVVKFSIMNKLPLRENIYWLNDFTFIIGKYKLMSSISCLKDPLIMECQLF